ncbi:MAG: GNAT family N-acetyltransferase [Candidatus Micrarchaeota archaeon]|nr:GNAT family N-acetyltransferase [Candidatus Micrarchaeota archaeon]
MRLETKRLILRDWNKNDIDDLIDGLNNYDVSKWLTLVPYPYTKKDAKNWITHCLKESNKKKNRDYHFAIELKSEKKVIGSIGVDKINKFHGLAHGGYWINEKYHKMGYGTEALGAKLKFVFNRLKLRRIESGFLKGNIPSLKLQRKFGFKVEGLRRKGFRSKADGKLKDEYITALLKEEWKER